MKLVELVALWNEIARFAMPVCFYGTFTFVWDSSVSIVTTLQAGRLSDGNSIPSLRVLYSVQTGPGAHRASLPLRNVKGKVVPVLN
jgi:hypothetical protein